MAQVINFRILFGITDFKELRIMKIKLLTTIATALALTACGSTQPEFTTEKDVNFKPDLEKHSLAYNIALSSGAPRAIKDAEVPQDAYDRISGTSHAASFINGFMIDGLGASLSFGLRSLAIDRMHGFDNVNVSLWVPVDSLDDYGSDEFEKQVDGYIANVVLNNFVSHSDLLSDDFYVREGVKLNFGGESCDKFVENNAVPNEFESKDSCSFYINTRIIRPVNDGDWKPDFLNLKSGNYVLVQLRSMDNFYTMINEIFPKGVTYLPPRFDIRYRQEGNWKSKYFGDGYPSYKYHDKKFLFIKPKSGK